MSLLLLLNLSIWTLIYWPFAVKTMDLGQFSITSTSFFFLHLPMFDSIIFMRFLNSPFKIVFSKISYLGYTVPMSLDKYKSLYNFL